MVTSLSLQYDSIRANPLDLKFLKQHMQYEKEKVEWFFSKSDNNWSLSNMAGGMPIHFDGKKWNSSEQLYQASKYPVDAVCLPLTSNNQVGAIANVRQRIAAQKAAKGAKMTQKCAVKAGLVRGDWANAMHEIRIYSMLWVLELKLYYNYTERNGISFARALKATGAAPIVEISKKDFFWGCRDTGKGFLEGQNVLGKLLQQVRNRIDEIRGGNFLYPNGFLLE